MTWRTILAAVVFIGVCGFIAYWGDLLGRRMGKRRLSLFGLRPRYTAIVTTTITGMLIAMLTIAFMATVSQRVRLLMLEGEKILRERSILISERESARKAAGQAKADTQRITADLDKLRVVLRRNQAVLADTGKQLADARLKISAAKREIATLTSERESALKAAGEARAEIQRMTTDLARVLDDLRESKLALANTEKQLVSAKLDVSSAKLEIAQRREEIARQRADIEDLEKRRSVLLQNLQALWEQSGKVYKTLRERTIIFRPGEELARSVIRCAQAKRDIRTEVLELLGESDKTARAQGAKTGDNGRAVSILAKKVETDDPGMGLFLEESVSIDAIVDQIASGSGTVVARIVSVGNSVEGEQAVIEFLLNYNLLVYSAGEEVARTVVDGQASQGEVLGQVIRFLRTEVRPAAMGRGIIPYYDKEQDQPSVGQISPDDLLDIVDRVKAADRPVTLTAVARVDTWSAGPLELSLRIGAAE